MHQRRTIPKPIACPRGQNNLLFTLPEADHTLIARHLRPVTLERGMVLEQPDARVKTVFFPITGIASMIAHAGGGRSIEVGLFGCEGMSGMSVLAGSGVAPNETFMQVAGEGLAIEADRLRDLLDRNASLDRHLLLFLHALFVQMAQTALANGKARLEERLARWLLMCHDRIEGDRIELTHESVAVMLGVRRAGVTVGTHLLEEKGLIRANRGEILIRDRDGLKEMAQGSYGFPEAVYARLFGSRKIYPGETRINWLDNGPSPSESTRT